MKRRFDDEWQIDSQFAMDVSLGLLKEKKHLSSKYFYDAFGSEIFNQITRHPDYYLTKCEMEILNSNKDFLSKLLNKESFNLVELGPGEGVKAEIIIQQFLKDALDFTYYAIDISKKYLDQLKEKLTHENFQLKMHTIQGDYFEGLNQITTQKKKKTMVLFLGSSIGNFTKMETKHFLRKIWQDLKKDDYLFIGFDLKKNVNILMQAYADKAGLTKAFNLNLLNRINRELKTNFDLSSFDHFAKYNIRLGAMESFLVSLKKQMVHSFYLNQTFHFRAFEAIHVERSYKFLLPQIEDFALGAGFEVVRHFLDNKGYFVNSLWRVCKEE